jgi:hypothetical protein
MNSERDRDKTIYRKKALIRFIQEELDRINSDTFSCDINKISSYDSLLSDSRVVKRTLQELSKESDNNLNYEIEESVIEEKSMTASGPDNYTVPVKRIWVQVKVRPKLDVQANNVEKQIQADEDTVQFVLESDGTFYPEQSPELKHSFNPTKMPYDFIRILAEHDGYVTTKKLSEKFGLSAHDIRTKMVGKIRATISRKTGLPLNSLFENVKDLGYRVVNVALKD